MSIEAIKLALEALEDAAYCVQNDHLPAKMGHDWDDVITALRTTIEQMEKKHPAEIDPLPRACHMAGVDYRIYLKIKSYMPVTPAAQRQWVGLTDEEYSQLHDGFHQQGKLLGWVLDQVEAKLREKNA